MNAEGWCVTAGHILGQVRKLDQEVLVSKNYEKDLAAAQSIADHKQRQAALKALKRPAPDKTRRWSVWWGGLNGTLGVAATAEAVDLGLFRLDGFDAASVSLYPTFKDPTKDFECGTSLCKLGFPLHSFTPTFDEALGAFAFPPGALPLPRFPLDGIFTRVVNLQPPPGAPPFPFAFMWVETSTPGLRGQSGGPHVDVNGTVWAIQCQTIHHPLGFNVHGTGKAQQETQFLNVGVGVHPTTMFALFGQHGVQFQVSQY